MEFLLDAADAAVVEGGAEPQRPDFTIPDELASVPTHDYLELIDDETGKKGKGWRARRDLPAGTLLMIAKPIAVVMDWEDDSAEGVQQQRHPEEDNMEEDTENEEQEPRMNELLLLALLARIQTDPSIWTDQLTNLFPRSENLNSLPAWVCLNDAVFCEVEAFIQQIEKLPALASQAKEISKRLPLIIRYNVLSIETCSELLSYPGPKGHSLLSGVGLFHLPSFFNHSSRPKCNRWAVGDVIGFVTNQDIPAGTEVCISYIEHDVLCESAFRRNELLGMDFDDTADHEKGIPPHPAEEQGPDLPVVDSDVQNELMSMDAFERLAAIDELMQQAVGAKLPEESNPEGDHGGQDSGSLPTTVVPTWFQCDVQNLRIIKAITLDSMGQSNAALDLWEEAVTFCETRLPPCDESSVVVHVQAALCAQHMGEEARAKEHAAKALQTHHILFGGGVSLFRRRFRHDLELKIRPSVMEGAAVEILWPISS